MKLNNRKLKDIKFFIGNRGLEILLAIKKGAYDNNTIQIFSGMSLKCIKGRMPILLELNLIKKVKKRYHLTNQGVSFLEEINEHF